MHCEAEALGNNRLSISPDIRICFSLGNTIEWSVKPNEREEAAESYIGPHVCSCSNDFNHSNIKHSQCPVSPSLIADIPSKEVVKS